MACLLAGALALASSGCGSSTGCRSDADCPAGTYCLLTSGECTFDCTRDADCPAGFRCTARGLCERGCVKTNGGVEACDGLDNDCDDETDEAFPELGQSCQNGGCAPGTWVCRADGLASECNGPQPAASDVTCDNFDDDCDGSTDEDAVPQPCPLQLGVCAGAAQHCLAGGNWSACDYGSDFRSDDSRCDQKDNDCDGATDEDAILLVPESGNQATDGIDNNCNGLVDERGGVVVPATGWSGVWIDAYEMAVYENADCTGQIYGQAGNTYPADWPADGLAAPRTLYACSLPGQVPSGHLSWYRAWRACDAQGKRLCRESEWETACNGASWNYYPYAREYLEGVCNDAYSGTLAVAPTGEWNDCTAGNFTWDMSGNLLEWLSGSDPAYPDMRLISGGSFLCELCTYGTNCYTCSGSSYDRSLTLDLTDCGVQHQAAESFPPASIRGNFGSRCCQDGP